MFSPQCIHALLLHNIWHILSVAVSVCIQLGMVWFQWVFLCCSSSRCHMCVMLCSRCVCFISVCTSKHLSDLLLFCFCTSYGSTVDPTVRTGEFFSCRPALFLSLQLHLTASLFQITLHLLFSVQLLIHVIDIELNTFSWLLQCVAFIVKHLIIYVWYGYNNITFIHPAVAFIWTRENFVFLALTSNYYGLETKAYLHTAFTDFQCVVFHGRQKSFIMHVVNSVHLWF